MAGLTVTEKEHWKERISRRIDKKIEAIAAEQPNLMDRVQRESQAPLFGVCMSEREIRSAADSTSSCRYRFRCERFSY